MKRSKRFLISLATAVLFIVLTTGCSNNKQGVMWHVETNDPNSSYNATIGDMYLNATTNDLFQLTDSGWNKVGNIQGHAAEIIKPTIEISEDGYWVINGEKTTQKALGVDGKDGQDGKDATGGVNGKNGKDGLDGKDGIDGTNGKDGQDGKDGLTPTVEIGNNGNWIVNGVDTGVKASGQDGISVYVGYDGYIWSGKERTKYKVENTERDLGITESTINIKNTMSKYFETDYLDLSKNTVALMGYYKPNAQITLYNQTNIYELSIYAEKDGIINIGTAKVEDVVKARTNGTTYTSTTKTYNVTKGLNVIQLDVSVGENETLIIGGNNSVGILYAKEIDIDDEQGSFTLINSKSNNSLEEKTNNIEDKLVIEVKAKLGGNEKAIFENIASNFSNVTGMAEYQYKTGNPYSYSTKTYFARKKIVRIGVPIKKVTAVDKNQFYTICTIKQSNVGAGAGRHVCEKTYRIYLPLEELSSTTVNKWIYTDVSDLNIEVGVDESLAFSAVGDNAILGYSLPQKTSKYNFYEAPTTTLQTSEIVWDIYYTNTEVLSEHIKKLEEKEKEAIKNAKLVELKKIIGGKNVSYLGDSITTFAGYSNDSTNTNSTIGSNAIYYTGSNYVTNVNDTWWRQVAIKSGMNVLVNNAWSGDKVTSRGQTRNVQLHDDTGENAGTNPDIIIVYLGINDYDGGVAVTTFTTSYDTMISNMKAKYPNADVFLMNFVPNKANSRPITDMEAYNKAVSDIADKYDATVVDLYKNSGITASTASLFMGDSQALHPNVQGMTAMANTVLDVLIEKYVK